MRITCSPLASLAILSALASAIQISRATNDNSKVLHFNVERRPRDFQNQWRRLMLRDDTLEVSYINSDNAYYTNISVGTPEQALTVLIDTGSSDLWAPYSGSDACTEDLCTYGSYDPDASSTFTQYSNDLKLSYADGTTVDGVYMSETVTIGGQAVDNFTMGLGTDTEDYFGIMGIGFPGDEASESSDRITYRNFPLALVDHDVVNTNAYSVWLDSTSSDKGNILFGGVDSAKYSGDFKRLDVVPDTQSGYVYLQVNLTQVVATSSSGNDTLTSTKFPITVVLDTGSSLSSLPEDIVMQMWNEVGAVNGTGLTNVQGVTSTYGLLPCSYSKHSGSFVFRFGGSDGPEILLKMSELVTSLTDDDSNPGQFVSGTYSGKDACMFGFTPTKSSYILGDSFLRSAYVTFDLANRQIALAQASFSSDSSVVAFDKLNATIPGSTYVSSQNATDSVASSAEPSYAAKSGFQDSSSDSAGSRLGSSSYTVVAFAGGVTAVITMLM